MPPVDLDEQLLIEEQEKKKKEDEEKARVLEEQQRKSSEGSPFSDVVSLAGGLALLGFFREKPKTLQETKLYGKLKDKRKEQWLKDHEAKNFSSQEGLDYLYGSVDEDQPSLDNRIEKEFEDRAAKYKEYEQNKMLIPYRDNQRYAKLVDKFDRRKAEIKNYDKDPIGQQTNAQIEEEIRQRTLLLKKSNVSDDVIKEHAEKIRGKRWAQFAEKYPEKASAFADKNKYIKAVLEKQDKEKLAYSLSERIKQYGGDFCDETKRQELIKNGIFSQKEADRILQTGLVQDAPGGIRFANDEAWNKAVYETSSGLAEEEKAINETRIKGKAKKTIPEPKSPSIVKNISNKDDAGGTLINKQEMVGKFQSVIDRNNYSESKTNAVDVANNIYSNISRFKNVSKWLSKLKFFGGGGGATAGTGATATGGAAAGGAGVAAGGTGVAEGAVAVGGGAAGGVGLFASGAGEVMVVAAIAIAVVIFIVVLILLLFSGGNNNVGESNLTPTPAYIGSGCPDTSNNTSNDCRYLNPSIDLFDTKISQQAIDNYISKYSGAFVGKTISNGTIGTLDEFKRRVNYIVSQSKIAELNPALFLGYWKSESYFSTVGKRDMGCAGNGFEEEVNCALGIADFNNPRNNPIGNCARSHDAESIPCLVIKSIRTNNHLDDTHPIRYPIATFDDFAEAYGPYEHRAADGRPGNCTHTYNILVEVAKELGECDPTKTTNPIPSSDLVSCPLKGTPTFACGSFESDCKYNTSGCTGLSGGCSTNPFDRGHCGSEYQRLYGGCSGETSPDKIKDLRIAHSIDLGAWSGEEVRLPTIGGKSVTWEFAGTGSIPNAGLAHVFVANVGPDKWTLQLDHVGSLLPSTGRNGVYNSGDLVAYIATIAGPHLHIDIGKNVQLPNSGPGWLNPEDLKMCVQ